MFPGADEILRGIKDAEQARVESELLCAIKHILRHRDLFEQSVEQRGFTSDLWHVRQALGILEKWASEKEATGCESLRTPPPGEVLWTAFDRSDALATWERSVQFIVCSKETLVQFLSGDIHRLWLCKATLAADEPMARGYCDGCWIVNKAEFGPPIYTEDDAQMEAAGFPTLAMLCESEKSNLGEWSPRGHFPGRYSAIRACGQAVERAIQNLECACCRGDPVADFQLEMKRRCDELQREWEFRMLQTVLHDRHCYRKYESRLCGSPSHAEATKEGILEWLRAKQGEGKLRTDK